jgi:hypothetical protein
LGRHLRQEERRFGVYIARGLTADASGQVLALCRLARLDEVMGIECEAAKISLV